MPGELDRLLGGVRAGARDHGNAALGLLDAPGNHLPVLFVRQGWAFAGGADRDEALGAFGDLPIHQTPEGFLVDRAVAERRDEGGKRAPEARPGGHDTIL